MYRGMLFLLALLGTGYLAVVIWVRRAKRSLAPTLTAVPELPAQDRPPSSAVGWPPSGSDFTSYVDEGFAALDAYLSEGFAA